MSRALALTLALALLAAGCVTVEDDGSFGADADPNDSQGPGDLHVVASDGNERQRLPGGGTVERPERPGSAQGSDAQGAACEWLLAWDDAALFEPVGSIAGAPLPGDAFRDQLPTLDVLSVDAAPAHGVPVALEVAPGPAPGHHLVAIGQTVTLSWEGDNTSHREEGWMRLTRIGYSPGARAWLGAHLPPQLPEDLYRTTVRAFLENVSAAGDEVLATQVAEMVPERVDPDEGRPAMNLLIEGPWRLDALAREISVHEPGEPEHPFWPVGGDSMRGGAWPADERTPAPVRLTLGNWTLGLTVPAARLAVSMPAVDGNGTDYLALQVDHLGHAWASLDTDDPLDRQRAHHRLATLLQGLDAQVPDPSGWSHGDDPCL